MFLVRAVVGNTIIPILFTRKENAYEYPFREICRHYFLDLLCRLSISRFPSGYTPYAYSNGGNGDRFYM